MIRPTIMHPLSTTKLRQLLQAVGEHLGAEDARRSALIVGGAALALRQLVTRTTEDVDVLALAIDQAEPSRLKHPEFDEVLLDAIARVARDHKLSPDWFNHECGAQWLTGLPPCASQDIAWLDFGGLQVGLASRETLITLKLFAAADNGPRSVHTQDLIALQPSANELRHAAEWVVTQDASPEFTSIVHEVVSYVCRKNACHKQ